MRTVRFCLSILAITVFVNVGASGAERYPFSELQKHISENGKPDTPMTGKLAAEIGVHDTENTEEYVLAPETSDSLIHSAKLLAKNGQIEDIVLATKSKTKQGAESKYYTLDPSGRLTKATLIRLKYDASGKAIEGAGDISDLKPYSKAVVKGLQHELDFWLKGKYRRQTGHGTVNTPSGSTTTQPATPQGMPAPEPAKP